MRVQYVFFAVVCALMCNVIFASNNEQEQLQPAALLETLVTYVPECGRPLCPASTLNAVIRGYECDCSKPQEHPDCGCAVLSSSSQSCSGSSSPCSQAPPCQCETKKPDCLCNALKSNQRIEVRPLYIEPVNPVPLPPAASTECVPSVFGVSPGSCKTHTQSPSTCGSSESNCASSSDSLSASAAIASSAALSSAALSTSASPASQSADSSIYSSMLSSQGGAPTPTSSASAIIASASAVAPTSLSTSAVAPSTLSASAAGSSIVPNSAAPKTSPAQSSATLTKF